MKKLQTILLRTSFFLFVLASTFASRAADPRNYAVELSANVQAAPPQIALRWVGDGYATGYSVYRKTPSAANWSLLTTLAGNATSWTDVSVLNGGNYEYAVTKSTSAGYSGTGYLLSGINVPVVEYRGKVVLIVDSAFTATLAAELARLQQDLVGDGWTVLRHDVSRNDSVVSVKNAIKADYSADPANVKAVFLFGHIPVPYSGNLNPPPDGHTEHQGAWPADAYYGDMDGTWTDVSVNNNTSWRAANRNVPGDGKFDQSDLPSDVELQVGRVDLSNMTCFVNKTPARTELDLLRAYLNKNHAFRIGQISVPRRGLIGDAFGDIYGENFASSGWRNSSSFFGPENSFAAPYGAYFSTLKENGYLWSYGAGGGTYTSCNGIGGSDDFALTDVKTVFTAFLGSYFGDWDNESAFLRAPLGSGYCLASVWAGRPHWFLHHMALGETIGYSTRVTQNNKAGGLYGSQNWGTRRVHVALMGDPTLRLHPVIPASDFSASTASSGVSLNWSASPDSNIQGYLVYRSSSMAGPFTRISGNALLTTMGMTDASGTAGAVYMVRAVKLEQSAGGTYYNPSIGTCVTAPAPIVSLPAAPSSFIAKPLSPTEVRLQWTDNSRNESGFNLLRKIGPDSDYTKIAVAANATGYTDKGLEPGTQYFYKISAWNNGGESGYSGELSATTPHDLVNGAFLGFDTTTGGSWKGVYGSEGYNVMGDRANYSIPVSVSAGAHNQWIWSWLTTAPAAPQRSGDSSRVAACWYSFKDLKVAVSLNGTAHHRLTVYCLDWNGGTRKQAVEILDANQNVLESRTIANFQKGIYLSFDVTGTVTVRIRPIVGSAVISGLFLDAWPSSLAPAATPVFTPNGGSLKGGDLVSISSATTGATIRYTTDGTEPDSRSEIYASPIALAESAVLTARAFAPRMADSPVASASFVVEQGTSPTGAKASFLGVDSALQGDWKGTLGTEAFSIPGDEQSISSAIQITGEGDNPWTWLVTTSDARCLQRASNSDRHASCAYNSEFRYEVDLRDGLTHNVSLYCLDWDRANRAQIIEIVDAETENVLHTHVLAGFTSGTYVKYALKGRVSIRIRVADGPNAVVSGIFVDPATSQL